ncbi:MAG: alpha/beta hydrolase [Ruminococcaceae bacterium]|nr:alpha/beta hydrolase [Oscillospiraceae bacterium]
MEKYVLPMTVSGKPYPDGKERRLIYFKVRYNRFRDLCTSLENVVTDKEEWAECQAVLCLPENYGKTGEKTPLILACHGAGSTVNEEKNYAGGILAALPCIDNGYAALDIDGTAPHGRSMGCPEHVFALYQAYKYAIKHYDLTEKVLLYGGSMGGQTATNFACTYPSVSLALGLFFPRMNIKSFEADGHFCLGTWDKTTPDKSGISTHDRVVENFHLEGGEWNYENIVGFEPYNNRSFTNAKGEKVVMLPCPIKIWHGTADTVVDPVVSREYVKAVRRGGCFGDLRLIEGVGHSVLPVMTEELRIWFNRFV